MNIFTAVRAFSLSIVLIMTCVMLSACNLGAVEATTEPPTPAPTRTAIPTVGAEGATLTPIPTSATAAACAVRPNWEPYTIQRGDTLTSIAQRTGTTVDALIEGNCLENPNRLRAGQEIRVPPPPTPGASAP